VFNRIISSVPTFRSEGTTSSWTEVPVTGFFSLSTTTTTTTTPTSDHILHSWLGVRIPFLEYSIETEVAALGFEDPSISEEIPPPPDECIEHVAEGRSSSGGVGGNGSSSSELEAAADTLLQKLQLAVQRRVDYIRPFTPNDDSQDGGQPPPPARLAVLFSDGVSILYIVIPHQVVIVVGSSRSSSSW